MSVAIDEVLHQIPLDKIDHTHCNARRNWRQKGEHQALDELVDSVRVNGVLNPILVRPEMDRFVLISGARRCVAAKRAEQRTIPARLCAVSDADAPIVQVIENIHRYNLDSRDEARVYWNLHYHGGVPVPMVAEIIHRSPRYIAEKLEVYLDATLGPARDKGHITLETGRLLMEAARWFIESQKRVEEYGENGDPVFRSYLFHEPLALWKRLEDGGTVTAQEVRDLLDHYKRWRVPHSLAGYMQMLSDQVELRLPYFKWVDPDSYNQMCAMLERKHKAAYEREERKAEEEAAAVGVPYKPYRMTPFEKPTVNSIAHLAPAPSILPPPDTRKPQTFAEEIADAQPVTDGQLPRQVAASADRLFTGERTGDVPRHYYGRSPEEIVVGPVRQDAPIRLVPPPTVEEAPEIVFERLFQPVPAQALDAFDAAIDYAMTHGVDHKTLLKSVRDARRRHGAATP